MLFLSLAYVVPIRTTTIAPDQSYLHQTLIAYRRVNLLEWNFVITNEGSIVAITHLYLTHMVGKGSFDAI